MPLTFTEHMCASVKHIISDKKFSLYSAALTRRKENKSLQFFIKFVYNGYDSYFFLSLYWFFSYLYHYKIRKVGSLTSIANPAWKYGFRYHGISFIRKKLACRHAKPKTEWNCRESSYSKFTFKYRYKYILIYLYLHMWITSVALHMRC